MDISSKSTIINLFKFSLLHLVALILVSCGQEEPSTSPSITTPAEPAAPVQAEPAPAPNLALEEPAELFAELPTHWLNEESIGDGQEGVTTALQETAHERADHWIQYGGGYNNYRHSPIVELSPQNIDNLEVAWAFPTGTVGQFSVSPLIYDGIMYITSSYNRLFAIDARTGELYWRYDHQQPEDLRICCGPVNRGASIHGDTVFMATLDARLLAFDRKSGELLWDTEIDDYRKGISATSAPLIAKDIAVIGVGGGEFGVRGFFDAYNINTGERVWRHYTVPAAGEPGVETWAGTSYETGGAPSWTYGAYDPELDLLYWTTGNPAPDWNGDARLGDNLFSDSVLAIDPDTGERLWYFQFTPHDIWDYDGNTHLFLVDYEHEGETIKGLVQANRNGFYYALNRETGEFLRATSYVEQLNWATSMEPNGRPVINPEMVPSEEPIVRICPGAGGGMNGSVTGAMNPNLGLTFIPVIESCHQMEKAISVYVEGNQFTGGTFIPVDAQDGTAYGHISAIDYQTGEVAWRYKDPEPIMAGVLSTEGGLVFTGSSDGHALALDAETGELLWRFRIGGGIRSQPVAYQLDGETYVAIASGNFSGIAGAVGGNTMVPEGGHLFVFRLGLDE